MSCFLISLISVFIIYFIIVILNFYILFNPTIVEVKTNDINHDHIVSLWNNETIYDAYIYITESEQFQYTMKTKLKVNDISQHHKVNMNNIKVNIPTNRSLWIHILIGKEDKKYHNLKEIVSHLKLPLINSKRSLNNSISHSILKILNVKLVNQHYNYSLSTIDNDLLGLLPLNKRDNMLYYLPLIMIEQEIWSSKFDYELLNTSSKVEYLNLTFDTCSIGWFRISKHLKLPLKTFETIFDGNELDDVKYAVIHTNPSLLLLTLVVSLLHMLFDILAFRSDINYWRSRQEFGGISKNTILMSTLCHIIITLYLFDQDANMLILISNMISTVISIWKIIKLFHFNIFTNNQNNIDNKSEKLQGSQISSLEIQTAQYDHEITNMISYMLIPIVCFSLIYSYWMYGIDTSIYSWCLKTFARAMYMFGFLLMLPQLYVNYKLKSVAHLNWSRLVYSALNTFTDDLFAFIIVMPDMHFWSVFRDDVVFFIFLFQRCLYPNRRSRVKPDIKKE